MFPEILVRDADFSTNLPQALLRSYHVANEKFLQQAERMKLHDGSTGISCVLREGKIIIANVGDCRAVIIRCGKAIQLTVP